MAEKKELKTTTIATFSKEAIIKSKKFKKHQDLLNAILDDKKKYSSKEVEQLIEETMKRKVK